MPNERAILHVDMDAFFASVEQLDHPELKGKPVLVGYDGPRGVVAAASYESRVFGCRSAQPMGMALRLCPRAIVVPVRHKRYRDVSCEVFAIFERYTPMVEPLSLDEAFLDVTGSQRLHGTGPEIAVRIRADIAREIHLTASVGVAPNKFLAKLASDMNKPDGLTVVSSDKIESLLETLPVSRMWGVGPKIASMLAGLGVKTFGDFYRVSFDILSRRVGAENAEHYQKLARGIDDRPVTPDREAKSIGQEQTFGRDLDSREALAGVLLEQTEQVAQRLRRHGLRAGTLTVKIRFGDFQTVTRRCTLPAPTDVTIELWRAARRQFERWAATELQPVRLIGVQAGGLTGSGGQIDLFPDPNSERQRRIDNAVDQINGKFGGSTIRRGRKSQ